MTQNLSIASLLQAYKNGETTPRKVLEELWPSIKASDPAIWISRPTWEKLDAMLQKLEQQSPDDLPLYGIPFAIKDNIDQAGETTTCACPAFAYTPESSAFVVEQLIAAGAIPVGKTNLDQFATGLVGVRSPYGIAKNAFDERYVPGGSSSGSAVAVALGLCSFALGTDTAGSGRIPASLNNLVGMKPTRGVLSNSGLVPACKTLDCISIFALTTADAMDVFDTMARFDPSDAFARRYTPLPVKPAKHLVVGVPRPDQLEFFGNASAAAVFQESLRRLETLGVTLKEIDLQPFLEAALLLYEGPWVAERYAGIEELIKTQPDALYPVTYKIISGGINGTAVDAFRAQYKLAELRRRSEPTWEEVDAIITPTAGTHYTVEEVLADPVQLNSNLGRYTNYMNLLDMTAWAVPAGFLDSGMPWGVTFFAPAFSDHKLAVLAAEFHAASALPLGRTSISSADTPSPAARNEGLIKIAVCGAHMQGLPLNHQLTDRGAVLVQKTHSADCYRLYHLAPPDPAMPARPGMVRVSEGGAAIALEVWAMPATAFGGFLEGIAAPLGLGRVQLEDGSCVCGFICEGLAAVTAPDITSYGGWRAWLAAQAG